jgi:hypothetical protein
VSSVKHNISTTWGAGTIGEVVTSIKLDVSSIEREVSFIKSDVSSIKSDVSSIEREMPSQPADKDPARKVTPYGYPYKAGVY